MAGHIRDDKLVPISNLGLDPLPSMLPYSAAVFAHSVSKDFPSDLLGIYSAKDVCTIMAIAMLRTIKPRIVSSRLSAYYNWTFVSKFYTSIFLSPNTVSTFLQKLSRDGNAKRTFYQRRADAVIAEHYIAVDGMLKQDTSTANDLLAFSYKARIKGCMEVSALSTL